MTWTGNIIEAWSTGADRNFVWSVEGMFARMGPLSVEAQITLNCCQVLKGWSQAMC